MVNPDHLKIDINRRIPSHCSSTIKPQNTSEVGVAMNERIGGHLLEELVRGHLGLPGRVGEVPPDVHRDLPLEHAVPVTEHQA